MSLFEKLFGRSEKKVSREDQELRGLHMPDIDLPLDEKFTINFKKNGGKFIYCDEFSEVKQALINIIAENNWEAIPFYSMDKRLEDKFSKESIPFTNDVKNTSVFFTPCEYLIAQNGSLLICSNQIRDTKLHDLPENFIVFATTSQIVNSIGEGLKKIKNKYKNSIPSNITAIKHFQTIAENKNDFLTYGSSSKNLYLVLLEDL